ncbi:MAG TPA: hybrid sensor histidine kinase/response regulator [Polyangiaceae bacterium]|nr:hybrid sensor histidine kinase/response regulator [Polyangiaceae bacterium]
MAKILHIEDDPANRLLVRKILVPAGFEVIDAADGLEGIRLARSERPDLVLVDIAIPGLDGYEVTLRLRAEKELGKVPIVAITAEGNRETALAVGCDGFIQKPIDARGFAQQIQGYLTGQREQGGEASTKHLRLQTQRIVGHLEEKVGQLSEANNRLVELDKARKEFYRNVSHELATPMTPIVGYMRMLLDGELGPLTPAQLKALRAVDDCTDRLRGLIDNLLDVTALESGRMRFSFREYDFLEMVQKAIAHAQPIFDERKIRLLTELPRGPLQGRGDTDRLRRALGQLLDNAAKFTPEGGKVAVRVREVEPSGFELCVADTGPGVAAEIASRVFDPFFQADGSETRAFGGAGIGLAIVRGVVQGHAGFVRVTSPANETIAGEKFNGAAFTLTVARSATSLSEAPSYVMR